MKEKATGFCKDCGVKLEVFSWLRCRECDKKQAYLGRLYRKVEPCPNCGDTRRKPSRTLYCNKKCKDEYKEKKKPHCVTKGCRKFVPKTGDRCAECTRLIQKGMMTYVFRRWRGH